MLNKTYIIALGIAGLAAGQTSAQTIVSLRPVASDQILAIHAIAADGSAVVGMSGPALAMRGVRWDVGMGGVVLPELLPIPAGKTAWPAAITADGQVTLGSIGDLLNPNARLAARWTASGYEMLPLSPPGVTGSWPRSVSADGSIIVGSAIVSGIPRGIRWVAGAAELEPPEHWPAAVSPDGSIIMGETRMAPTSFRFYRWMQATGTQVVGDPVTGSVQIDGMRSDGSVAVGVWMPMTGGWRAFRVDNAAFEPLPSLPGTTWERAHAVSDDGSLIVGGGEGAGIAVALVWTDSGVQLFSDWLTARGYSTGGWSFHAIQAMTPDGRTFAGIGRDPSNNPSGFVLTLPPPCYANCDQSTAEPILTVDDFTCFIDEFAAAQGLPHEQQLVHYANCDGSTAAPVLNVDDFTCFINAFAAGCP